MYCTIIHVHENCEGWLSPGGHSSGGRALTAKVRGPQFNPGWLLVFHGSLKVFLSLFIMHTVHVVLYIHVYCPYILYIVNV